MQWITENILAMGGMQACDFTLEKTPNEGLQLFSALSKNTISTIQLCCHSFGHDDYDDDDHHNETK